MSMSAEPVHQRPDFNAALALLAAVRLPVVDLTPAHCENFFYTGSERSPKGMVGLELFGAVALLRSLAVASDAQRSGSGSRLLAHAEGWARAQGVHRLYLLTTTAESFFAKHGYQPAPRESAPEAIRRTREFSGICPASSAFMVKTLS